MSVPLEFTLVTTVHVLSVSTQREAMCVFVSQATLEMERLASLLVLVLNSSIASERASICYNIIGGIVWE